MELSDDDSPERNENRGQRYGNDLKHFKSKSNVLLHDSDREDEGDDGADGVMWPSNTGKPQRRDTDDGEEDDQAICWPSSKKVVTFTKKQQERRPRTNKHLDDHLDEPDAVQTEPER